MEISESVLKLIMSKTKRDILKALLERRKMLSEISAELNRSMPTIKEHLAALEKGELVVLFDDGHKWKYYELTEKGKDIVAEAKPQITFTIMFVIPIVLVVAGMLLWQLPIYSEIAHLETQTFAAPKSMPAETAVGAATTNADGATAGAIANETAEPQYETITTERTVIEKIEPEYIDALAKAMVASGLLMFIILAIKNKSKIIRKKN